MIKKIAAVLSTFLWMLMTAGMSFTANAQPEPIMKSIASAGDTRDYMLYIPETSNEPLPLVFNFHGSGGVPQGQQDISQFISLAEERGFAVVFPAGVFTNSVSSRSWNANVEDGVDDVQFVRDMIEDVAAVTNLDRNRIYVTGFSGGGRISSRLACELSDVLAAAAPVAGIQYPDDCRLKRVIPILTFHGQADLINPYTVDGEARPYWRMGVETAVDKWRQANGCSFENNSAVISEQVTQYAWRECEGTASVQIYIIEDGGHTWPGSESLVGNDALGVTNMDINASELIWEFFSQHSL